MEFRKKWPYELGRKERSCGGILFCLLSFPHFKWIKELLKIKMQNHSQTNQVRMASAELGNIWIPGDPILLHLFLAMI